jgi:signal transduction histidine kinase
MAALLGSLANFLGFQFDPHWGLKLAFVTSYTAFIMISAWFGGLGPGLVCTGLCAWALAYFWTEPPQSLSFAHPGELLGVAVFIGNGGVISAFSEALHRARRREEQARMHREELLAFVAHDLRNPLNAINVTAMLIEKGAAPGEGGDKLRRQIAVVRRSVQQMTSLIGDLLDFAVIEAGKLSVTLTLETLDELRSLVQELYEMHLSVAQTRAIELTCDVSEAVTAVRCDRDRIIQVLSNLIGNAMKFTPEGGRIAVRIEPCNGGVSFSVRDTGAGIPEAQLPHIFERYWHEERARGGGTGLGLYICKSIVAAHGSRLEVRSEPGSGSTFFFTLPAVAPSGSAGQGYQGQA